jgi:hypothetical protein
MVRAAETEECAQSGSKNHQQTDNLRHTHADSSPLSRTAAHTGDTKREKSPQAPRNYYTKEVGPAVLCPNTCSVQRGAPICANPLYAYSYFRWLNPIGTCFCWGAPCSIPQLRLLRIEALAPPCRFLPAFRVLARLFAHLD